MGAGAVDPDRPADRRVGRSGRLRVGHAHPATRAASDRIAETVDLAQYAQDDGPCLTTLRTGEPVAVPDVAGAVVWPRFRDAAWQNGVRASLSVPLFAGSGETIAALNLYARDAVGISSSVPSAS
ncbi:GAF domain-containing protein [Micromonospora sp. BQ11]|uniref:GAF domain-containing protein n=1 Tax=Micromonospora sp. BQ11 TaxID=3452212 RepID=UPI003F8B29A1